MHVILTGATGTIGAPVLRQCLVTPKITKLTILSRREVHLPEAPDNAEGIWNAGKVHVVLLKDFTGYSPEILSQLQGAESVIWAQGRSQNGVSKEEYIQVTNAYPITAARAFPRLSPTGRFTFVHVSGEGATQDESASSLYGKIKGRTEKQLLEMSESSNIETEGTPRLKIYNIRPGWVDPEGQPVPTRPMTKKIFEDRFMGPILKVAMPGIVSPSSQLAKVLVDLAVGDGEPLPAGQGIEDNGRTVRSDAIRRL